MRSLKRHLNSLDSALAIFLIAGLAWVPFWLGSNRLLPWAINALLFPGLVIAYEVSLFGRAKPHPVSLARIWIAASLFATAIIWILIQMLTVVPPTLAHPIYAMAQDALQTDVAGSISVNRTSTGLALIRLLTDAAVFWLALQLGRDGERALIIVFGVAYIVAAYAIYGLLTFAFANADVPFFDVVTAAGYVRSTFVNRNSFATYAGLGLIAQIAALLRMYRHAIPDARGLRSYRASLFIEATGRTGLVALMLTITTMIALLLTGSRGGILATLLALFALIVLSFARGRKRRSERVEAILFVTAGILAAFLFFGDLVVGRITSAGLVDTSRWAVDLIALRSLSDAPILGFGYGTFADIFPLYRDQSISPVGVWDKAHNTYLEVLQGLGLVFGTALIAVLVSLVVKAFLGAFKRKANATASIVASAASLLVGVHALVDFSLQIEAVAITYMALLGVGVAQAESSRQAVSD